MSTALVLPAELTIYSVAELRTHWLAWLEAMDDAGPGQVDASAVAEVDAAGLQLLLSLSGALDRRRRALQLLQPSAALRAACQALGLDSQLIRDTR
jgi:anti-anti-sigma regulatory factor